MTWRGVRGEYHAILTVDKHQCCVGNPSSHAARSPRLSPASEELTPWSRSRRATPSPLTGSGSVLPPGSVLTPRGSPPPRPHRMMSTAATPLLQVGHWYIYPRLRRVPRRVSRDRLDATQLALDRRGGGYRDGGGFGDRRRSRPGAGWLRGGKLREDKLIVVPVYDSVTDPRQRLSRPSQRQSGRRKSWPGPSPRLLTRSLACLTLCGGVIVSSVLLGAVPGANSMEQVGPG